MKNRIKLFGLIAIAAIITFTMTACGGDPGGGGIPARLRAYDNQGTVPSLSVINARSAMNIMPMSAETEPGLVLYSGMYSNSILGAHKEFINVTKFELKIMNLRLDSPDHTLTLIDGSNAITVDFARPGGMTFNLGEVPEGERLIGVMMIIDPDMGSTVEFELPVEKQSGMFWNEGGGTTITARLQDLELGGILSGAPGTGEGSHYRYYGYDSMPENWEQIGKIAYFCYGGTQRMMANKTKISHNAIDPNVPASWEIGDGVNNVLVIPINPVTVTAGASYVEFSISWNLTGLIERREGKTASADDDIFILKDGWWNGLQITVVVQ